MNTTVSVLKNHATIREFDSNYKISKDELEQIITSAKQAPSWMNGQAYSIIIFEGKEKEKLAQLLENDPTNTSNAATIRNSNLFLLFNIDLSLYNISANLNDESEPLLISAVDCSLALENALIASESLGLGTCVIGGLRRNSDQICHVYQYPKYVFPLMGLAMGKPVKHSKVKPRLPFSTNVFDAESLHMNARTNQLEDYNKALQAFSLQSGYTSSKWTERFKDYYENKKYPQKTKETLQKQSLV